MARDLARVSLLRGCRDHSRNFTRCRFPDIALVSVEGFGLEAQWEMLPMSALIRSSESLRIVVSQTLTLDLITYNSFQRLSHFHCSGDHAA